MKIYLAGPLFTTPERVFNVQLATRLRAAGHEVLVPQDNPASKRTGKAIFLKDLEGLAAQIATVSPLRGHGTDEPDTSARSAGAARADPSEPEGRVPSPGGPKSR